MRQGAEGGGVSGKIVAGFDLGVKGASCYGEPGGRPCVDTWDLAESVDSPHPGALVSAWHDHVRGFMQAVKPALIVFEQVVAAAHHKGAGSGHAWAGYRAILFMEAFRAGVPVEPVYYSTAKRQITGNGGCEKIDVLVHLRRQYPTLPLHGFDAGDALAIWLVGCRDLKKWGFWREGAET